MITKLEKRIEAKFREFELLRRGESKEIRLLDQDHVIIRMIPSLYSYTKNRSAIIEGTEHERLVASAFLWNLLETNGIETVVAAIGVEHYTCRRMIVQGEDYCPPVEVVVKGRHVGTPKHRLYRIEDYPTLSGERIKPEAAHAPYTRFDFTNPLHDADGNRLHDECIPTGLAARFMDAVAAEETATAVFEIMHKHMSARGIRLDDICLKIDHTGRAIFGEISPDCMRAVYVGEAKDFFANPGEDASKDTFRRGSSPEETLASYRRFNTLLKSEPIRDPVPLCGT